MGFEKVRTVTFVPTGGWVRDWRVLGEGTTMHNPVRFLYGRHLMVAGLS